MADVARQHIFCLDDEPAVCKAVSEILRERGFEMSCFTRPADCLQQLRRQTCDLLITDLKMPEMDGIELLAKVKHVAPWVPVLLISAYGDIPTAVAATKAGAADFIEKPFGMQDFVAKVVSILQRSLEAANTAKLLTQREMTVLRMVVDGKTSKEIASLLKRSKRTITCYRRHIMDKLGVDNVADLTKKAVTMGLVELPTRRERGQASEDSREFS